MAGGMCDTQDPEAEVAHTAAAESGCRAVWAYRSVSIAPDKGVLPATRAVSSRRTALGGLLTDRELPKTHELTDQANEVKGGGRRDDCSAIGLRRA